VKKPEHRPKAHRKAWRFPAGEASNCTHCGMCIFACPVRALDFGPGRLPQLVRAEACNLCGVCARVCPGGEIDFAQTGRSLGLANEYDPWLGPVRDAFLAHDTEPGGPRRSASGGAVTAVLGYALRAGLIDAAVVTAPDPADPLLFRARLARSPEELDQGRQSKYQTIPLALALSEAADNERIGFAGNGCQVAALRKLQETIPAYRTRVPLVLGIFCSTGNLSLRATEFMVRKGCGLAPRRVKQVEYRHGPYPGAFMVACDDQSIRVIAKDAYKWLYTLYTTERCMRCIDLSCELADISFGDPFELCNRPEGQSVAIVRSSLGQEVLAAAVLDGGLAVEPVAPERVVAAQGMQFYISRVVIPGLNARRGMTAFHAPRLPEGFRGTWKSRIKATGLFTVFRFRRLLRWVFDVLPFRAFAMVSRLTGRG